MSRTKEAMIEDDGFITIDMHASVPCETCEGSGEARLFHVNSLHPDNWTTCKVCNGTGTLSATQCERCGYDLESEHPGFLYSCPACAGVA
jgi:DnaJ-class molecular chaperone